MTNSREIYNKCETRHSGYEISQIDELIVSWAFRFLAENKKLNRKIFLNVILFDTFVCHTNSHIALAVISINFHTETARGIETAVENGVKLLREILLARTLLNLTFYNRLYSL